MGELNHRNAGGWQKVSPDPVAERERVSKSVLGMGEASFRTEVVLCCGGVRRKLHWS
jgi:hypothetical protein